MARNNDDDLYGGFGEDSENHSPLQIGGGRIGTSGGGFGAAVNGRMSASRRGQSRMGIGTANAKGNATEDRPLTAVRAAGYSSSGRNNAVQSLSNAGNRGPAPPLQKPDRSAPEEQAKEMERKVNLLLEESTIANSDGNVKLALEKAKEASKAERSLCRYRDVNGMGEQINLDLSYAVQFNLAVQYQASGLNEDALNAYSVIVRNKQYAQSGRLRVNMGNIYYAEKKYPTAIKMYRMALDQVPNTGKEIRYKIMRNIGNAFVKLGQYQDAIQSYEGIMEGNSDINTGFNLVVCYFALGDKEKMKKGFAKLVSTRMSGFDAVEEDEDDFLGIQHDVPHDDPLKRHQRDRQNLARKYVLCASKLISPVIEKDFIAGYDYVIDALRSTPFQSITNELEIAKASTFLKIKKFDQAIEQLKQFEKRDQTLASIASTNLSFLYFLEGDIKNAEKYAEASLQTDSYNAKAIVNRGNIHFLKAEYEQARDMYKEAHTVDVECWEALYNLGLTLKKLGRFEAALDQFERLRKVMPNSADVFFHIGDLHDIMKNTDAAIDAFTRLLAIVPTDPGVLARLGHMYIRGDDDSSAYNYHIDSYKLYPVNLDVISWLGAYFVKNEVYEKAIVYFERASQIQSNEVKWQLMIASCHRRIGAYQQALDTYKLINQRFPENTECLRYIINICTDMGRTEDVHEYVALLKKAERAVEAKAQIAAERSDRKTRKKKPDQPADALDFADLNAEPKQPRPQESASAEDKSPHAPALISVENEFGREKAKTSVKMKSGERSATDEEWGEDLDGNLLPGM